MATIAEVEKLALDLPETERAALAAHLLGSLPSVLHDEDEGIAEALRRDAEFEANPSLGMTLEELDQRIENRRTDAACPSEGLKLLTKFSCVLAIVCLKSRAEIA